jgi:hypothetical protein
MPSTISTLGAAGVDKRHRLDSLLACDVDAYHEHANAGEEGAVDPAASRVDAVGELAQDLARLDDEVVTLSDIACRPVTPTHIHIRGDVQPLWSRRIRSTNVSSGGSPFARER